MQPASDRWISVGLSVLLHAALVGALVYGWMLFRHPPQPAPTLAIEANVVDARTVRGLAQATAPPAPPPAPPQPAPEPPQPTPQELAQREAAKQQAEAAARQRQEQEEREAQKELEEEQRKADEQRREDADRKAEAEKKALAEKKAQEAALAQQKAAEAQEQQDREADLKRSLAAEEHAARAGPQLASWQAQIAARIARAWLRPPTARPGIECVLNVTQVPGGEVTKVDIGECNGDQAVRESIQDAVYRASPLPPPPDPSLFERNLTINFKPD